MALHSERGWVLALGFLRDKWFTIKGACNSHDGCGQRLRNSASLALKDCDFPCNVLVKSNTKFAFEKSFEAFNRESYWFCIFDT